MSDRLKKIKLFSRGKKKLFYFRMNVNGKDKWISTKSSDKNEAQVIANAILNAEQNAIQSSKTENSAVKIANKLSKAIVKDITGDDIYKLKLEDMLEKWIAVTPTYHDVVKGTQKKYHTIFKRFNNWINEKNIYYAEDVSNEYALQYAKWLWESGISGKTYNDHIKHLSRVFSCIDSLEALPYRDPFNKRKIPRKRKSEIKSVGHLPLEPEMLDKVIKEAATISEDYRDLIIVGSQTGMRFKDAVYLKWEYIEKDFIDFIPCKTFKTGKHARIPISQTMRELLNSRTKNSIYIFHDFAESYSEHDYVINKKVKRIFVNALGKNVTNLSAENNRHRKNSASIYSYHSLRTTFMSLLASQDVSIRDAMNIMAWESSDMIKNYEKLLEKARGDSDKRALKLINSIDDLNIDIPEIEIKLTPTKDTLEKLVKEYSNVTIGRIYGGISEAAIRKHLKKHNIERQNRIENHDITDEQIEIIKNKIKDDV